MVPPGRGPSREPAEPCKPVAGGSEPPDSRSLLRQRLAALTFTVGDGSSAPFKVVALEDIDNALNQYAAGGRPAPAWQPLEHIAAFCEQVAADGILPSRAWFSETANVLRALSAPPEAK